MKKLLEYILYLILIIMSVLVITNIIHSAKTYKPSKLTITRSQAVIIKIKRKNKIEVKDIYNNKINVIKNPYINSKLGDTLPIIYYNELMSLDYQKTILD